MEKSEKETRIEKRLVYITLAILAMIIIYVLPSPEPLLRSGQVIQLSHQGKACIAILIFAIILWITEAIPFPVTALTVLVSMPILKITSFKEAISIGFGNPIIAFFIGVLIISTGFSTSGLGKRIGYFILTRAEADANRVILGFLFSGAVLSMWITDMAVAAILLPLAVEILKTIKAEPLRSNFGKGLLIACCWGPLFGGIATPAGCGPNPLTIGFLKKLAGVDVSFLRWMILGVPASLLMIPFGYLILTKIFPPEWKKLPINVKEVEKKLGDLGNLSRKEKYTLAIFLFVAVMWVASPFLEDVTGGIVTLSIHSVAILGAIMFFLPGIDILSWKDVQKRIDWGPILLIVAGLSLGIMMYNTGAVRWLAWLILGEIINLNFTLRIFVIVLVVSLMHCLFSSNTVTGTIMIPLLISLAHDLGMDPWLLAAPAAFSSSLAFILVTETPTNLIPYSAGYFSIKDMAKVGVIMTVVAAFCVTISLTLAGLLSVAYR